MTTFTTPKGTVLPIASLKGKDYLLVAHRLVWFREEHPDWTITCEFVALAQTHAIAKAIISDKDGRVLATAHKREDAGHFADFMEKAETGAIGRALAYCGYGTQFCADDLAEDNRIVDAPTTRPQTKPPVKQQVQDKPKPVIKPTAPAPTPKKSSWEDF